MNRKSDRVCLILTAILVGGASGLSAQQRTEFSKPDRPAQSATRRGDMLKPGYFLLPKDIPALAGYKVDNDHLDVDRRGTIGIKRAVTLSSGPQSIAIHIGLSQVSVSEVNAIINEFVGDSQMRPEDRFVDGQTLGIKVGDQNRVGGDSTSSNIPQEIVFSRSNIFVSVQRASDSAVNLKPIAEDIDAAIQALPNVTLTELNDNWIPTIATFSAESTNLYPGEQTNLTLQRSDPQLAPLTTTYIAPEGDVLESPPPPRYRAGSKIGTQPLDVVVVNPSLLFANATLNFNVTSP